MKINKQKIEAINEQYSETRRKTRGGIHGLNVADGVNGATVYSNNWQICTVEELQSMIIELVDMRNAIEKETGIC